MGKPSPRVDWQFLFIGGKPAEFDSYKEAKEYIDQWGLTKEGWEDAKDPA